jgi:uncharacterized protein
MRTGLGSYRNAGRNTAGCAGDNSRDHCCVGSDRAEHVVNFAQESRDCEANAKFEIMADRGQQLARGEWRVAVGGETTTALYEPPSSVTDSGVTVIFAHGAGGNMNDRGVLQTANALRERGIGVVRFNFLYKEKKSSRPDAMPKLKDTFSAVVAKVREELNPATLVLGGRSMGGRASSMLVADGFPCQGLLLLAYPLHPPGKPDQLRDAHLPSIRVPVLCFNGTRDPFCTPALMEEVLKRVTTNWQMEWIEGADHSFHVLKSSGTTDAAVLARMADGVSEWIAGLTTSAGR